MNHLNALKMILIIKEFFYLSSYNTKSPLNLINSKSNLENKNIASEIFEIIIYVLLFQHSNSMF